MVPANKDLGNNMVPANKDLGNNMVPANKDLGNNMVPAPSEESRAYVVCERRRVEVRVGRIELPPRPWQGRVLPLNDTRLFRTILLSNTSLHRFPLPSILSTS
jgi:hypothetical protein